MLMQRTDEGFPGRARLRWSWLIALSLCTCLLGIVGCGGEDPKAVDSNDDSASDDDGEDDSAADDDDNEAKPSLDAGKLRDAGAGGGAGKDSGKAAGDAGGGGNGGKDGSSAAPDAGGKKDASMDSSGGGGNVTGGSCSSLPPTDDYAAKGPFADAKMFENAGPNGSYLLYRPDASLGKDGFKHPVATWGNGIATTPDQYKELLTFIASHGFVVIACPDTTAERPCLNDGMDWLVAQNTAEGPLKGKLDTSTEVTIGYSWGGGASIDTANRPNVKATVSFHGMPPRGATAFEDMHAPLLLFSSTGDTFVTPEGYVTPNFDKSTVQTFYAILQKDVGHLYIIDTDAISCVASILLSGPCGGAQDEQASAVAWLRYWACGDQGAKKYFYGSDCELCDSQQWKVQKKNWPTPDTP